AGLGVIPVSRVRDARALKARGENVGVINTNAFLRVVDALKTGHAVAIFPEGNVNDAPHLGLLRSGAAKMALQAVESGVDLTMIAVGYQYESPTTPRSGLLAVVGKPVRVADWKPLNAAKAVAELTKFMRYELQQVTRNSRTHSDADELSKLSAISGALFSTNVVSPIAAAQPIQCILSHHSASDGLFVANAVAPESINNDHLLAEFQTHASTLSDRCVALGARRWSARDCAEVLAAAGDQSVSIRTPNLLLLVVTAPLAALAWIWHALPMWVAHKLAIQYAPLRVEIAARTLVPGMYVIWMWYLALPFLLLTTGVNRWLVLAVFIAQPRLGDFAWSWCDQWRAWRLVQRVRDAPDAERAILRALAHETRLAWARCM
ncbi:MAG: hypothetical protein ABI120_10870, partial [Gemmatimonadaceae bacterium]